MPINEHGTIHNIMYYVGSASQYQEIFKECANYRKLFISSQLMFPMTLFSPACEADSISRKHYTTTLNRACARTIIEIVGEENIDLQYNYAYTCTVKLREREREIGPYCIHVRQVYQCHKCSPLHQR